jgi:hypothetical protein
MLEEHQMKEMDYVVTGAGARRTITPRSERAKQRTPETQEFADNASALEFVKAGVEEGYRFSGREIIDREYRLARYGYFVKTEGSLACSGQDWGPPDPVFEPGDTYPGGPRNGKHATVLEVITGEFAKKNGLGVMVILGERDVSKVN